MTRAAGISAVMYGAGVQGVADSLLKLLTSTLARAAAHEGGGKQKKARTLYVSDGAQGTLDPAFDAHALLAKHWALAWWEGWVSARDLDNAFCNVKNKFRDGFNCWNRVAGHTAALWLSFKRAGSVWSSARTARDNLWRTWDFLCDPPTAIAGAMRRTVRYNRFMAVVQQIPGLIPDRVDTGPGRSDNGYIVIGFARILCSPAAGKNIELKDTPEWERKHAPYLLSAARGGQRTQTRRAAVKKWGVTDSRCQLCFGAPGTVEHRRTYQFCKSTGGWSDIPEKAKLAANRIGTRRLRILRDTGMLAIKLHTLPDTEFDTFQWGSAPPDFDRTDVRCFIDASMLEPKWRELSTLGFAVAVVADDGSLLEWR